MTTLTAKQLKNSTGLAMGAVARGERVLVTRRGKAFEYLMYVDVMAGMDDPAFEAALHEVERHTSMVRVLGSYRSAADPV